MKNSHTLKAKTELHH